MLSSVSNGYTRLPSDPKPPALRAVHIVAGLGKRYGGIAYSVPTLCAGLGQAGAQIEILSVCDEQFPSSNATHGYRDSRFPVDFGAIPILRRLHASSGLANALNHAATSVDVIHNHGIWLMPNVQAGWAARAAGKPLVVSPRGMLAPAALNFSRIKKKAFWALLQGSVVRQAACLHATSEAEYQEIRSLGLRNPVTVISNGIDVPSWGPTENAPPTERVALSLGRLHPKKGLDRLIRAWALVEAAHPDWRLRIIGSPERGYDGFLRALIVELGLARVTVEGPLYDDEKKTAYRQSELFLLPSLNENFGLTVAEALAASIPVISSKGAPWQRLETEGCGWWIDHGVTPLALAMEQAMAMPRDSLKAMGAQGSAWMLREFSWDRVVAEMLAVYEWLARGRPPPSSVRFD